MEMILETLKLNALAFLVEQSNCGSNQEIVHGRVILHHKLILATLLVVLKLLLSVDISVLELENTILEGVEDGHAGLEVDWCLLNSIADDTLLFSCDEIVVGSQPVVFRELAWTLVEGVHVIFAIIIIEIVLMFVGAAWHAADHWELDAIDDVLLGCFDWLIQSVKLEQIELDVLLWSICVLSVPWLWREELAAHLLFLDIVELLAVGWLVLSSGSAVLTGHHVVIWLIDFTSSLLGQSLEFADGKLVLRLASVGGCARRALALRGWDTAGEFLLLHGSELGLRAVLGD